MMGTAIVLSIMLVLLLGFIDYQWREFKKHRNTRKEFDINDWRQN